MYGRPLYMAYNLCAPTPTTARNPRTNISEPRKPKMCIGCTPNFDKNHSEIKSKYPFTKRFKPNLVTPYLRAWCCTTFSPILANPAFLAKYGM